MLYTVLGYLALSGLCLLSLIKATFSNPGRVPMFDHEMGSGDVIF